MLIGDETANRSGNKMYVCRKAILGLMTVRSGDIADREISEVKPIFPDYADHRMPPAHDFKADAFQRLRWVDVPFSLWPGE